MGSGILKRFMFWGLVPTEKNRLHVLEVRVQKRGLLSSNKANKGTETGTPGVLRVLE